MTNWLFYTGTPLIAIVGVAALLRFWRLTAVGFNSDEAVYSGTAASIAGNETLRSLFPIFRSHPLLLQIVLSFGMHEQVSEWAHAYATRRLGDLATAAASGRSDLRTVESDLAGTVVDLQLIREQATLFGLGPGRHAPEPTESPYQGLASFDVGDSWVKDPGGSAEGSCEGLASGARVFTT